MIWTCVLFLATAASSASAARIVGGDPTTVDQYPSIVQLEKFGQHGYTWSQSCGANILNNLYVVTAAHCFEPDLIFQFRRIRAGATYRDSGGYIHTFSQAILHPEYSKASIYDADIALARLRTQLIYSNVISPTKIPTQDYELPDSLPVVHAGWGATSFRGEPSPVLRDVTIFSINRALCRERYANRTWPILVTDNMICGGILDVGGKDACGGDSGGPLYYMDILVGIISWGEGCADEYFPGVSTRVSSYTNWIIDNAV